ncbi:MAG: hypothetical protein K6G17_03730 [Oscillospiraceae bacterium]|nr:hypothetical protein [Oscillospiraceae bacterium]
MKLKAIIDRMCRMNETAWTLFKSSLQLSVALLFSGLLLTVGDDGSLAGHTLARTAMACYETPQSLLLIGLLLSVVAEDQQSRS